MRLGVGASAEFEGTHRPSLELLRPIDSQNGPHYAQGYASNIAWPTQEAFGLPINTPPSPEKNLLPQARYEAEEIEGGADVTLDSV
jgi:hypothetical protein